MAWRGKAWQGAAWPGGAWQGRAGLGMARPGRARRSMAGRQEFSGKVKKTAWERCAGRCEKCNKVLWGGDRIFDHIWPCFLSGQGSLENCQVLCRTCDAVKTRGDHKTIAKSKKTQRRHQAHLARMALKGRGVSEARPRRRWA